MRKILLLFTFLAGCDGAGLTVTTPDAGHEPDATPCAEWGLVTACPGGGPCGMVCLSYVQRACPAPWPCVDGGES